MTTGTQDAWDFGTANQYPTLKYGELVADHQRPTVTLSVKPTKIWERAPNIPNRNPNRVAPSTVTATLSKAWNEDVVVTLPTSAAYTMSAATVTIAAGSMTGTATLTAVNNFLCGTSDCPSAKVNNAVSLAQATHPADTKWASKGTDVNITINDDDSLGKPGGVKLSVDGTKIRVDWTAVTNATGYRVEWNGTSATDWSSKSSATGANTTQTSAAG